MNKKIRSLKAQIEMIESKKRLEMLPLKQALKLEYNKVLDKNVTLQDALKQVDNSSNYMLNEYGDLVTWTRIDLGPASGLRDVDADTLTEYVADYGYSIDLEHNCLLNFQGEYIGINEDGDIYLSDSGHCTWIIDHDKYETIEERNELIEMYMTKTGSFPGVFEVNKYGDITLVNTQKQSIKA